MTKDVDRSMKQFYTIRDSLTTVQRIVFFDNRFLYIYKVERLSFEGNKKWSPRKE